ncbi:MAG: hypothetical protein ABSD41_11460 [Candidatus Bathyarchaeia archaeon]
MTNTQRMNTKSLGHTDLCGNPNGGQVVVQRRGKKYYAFVGHLRGGVEGMGTSIIDVTSPDSPEVLSQIRAPDGTHSHKVRVSGNIMLVNNEPMRGVDSFEPGLRIFDVKDLSDPKELAFFRTGGRGVHRFSIDEEKHLAYLSAGADGYVGNILRVVNFSDPKNPREDWRWWLPGQWKAGGEKPDNAEIMLHLAIIHEQRAYLAYWDAGFIILNISNTDAPQIVSRANYHPPYGGGTHTALPVSREILGRRWMIVFDEAVEPDLDPPNEKLMWVVDITNEKNPVSVSTYSVPESENPKEENAKFGPHQPYEDTQLKNDLVYATWFSAGLRIISVENPFRPTEVGYFVPPREKGKRPVQTNDVYVDDRGLIYLIDRWDRGMDIVEYTEK